MVSVLRFYKLINCPVLLFQVAWSGRCREGAGLSIGETTELANNYMSRFGPVTRGMEATGDFMKVIPFAF